MGPPWPHISANIDDMIIILSVLILYGVSLRKKFRSLRLLEGQLPPKINYKILVGPGEAKQGALPQLWVGFIRGI